MYRDLVQQYLKQNPDLVAHYNRKIHINESLRDHLDIRDDRDIEISVQRLLRKAGKNSGLGQRIREYSSRWGIAWLRLIPVAAKPGWFRILVHR